MDGESRAIAVHELVKRYDGRAVVDGVSFDVAVGECLALLGPNGAGKTTTVEILEGYRAPDGGSARVLGLDPLRQAAALKPRIGVMLQDGGIYPSIRPLEALEHFARFFARPARPAELLDLVGLRHAARTRFRQLSGGEKQRLSLALALVGQPEVVFLDEPTAGMDPQARRATWEIVAALKSRGVTIMLTTHFLDEAERLADRVAILDRGRLLAIDTPVALRAHAPASTIRFLARPGLDLSSLPAGLGAARATEERPGEYVVRVAPTPAAVALLARWLADQDVLVSELRVGAASLEDVYLRLTSNGAG